MPIYKYQCHDCGLQFERSVKFADRAKAQGCECGSEAQAMMPENVSFSFNQKAQGVTPQNTGVTSFDAKVDRVIGAHAREGWQEVEKRHDEKRRILKNNPGVAGTDLSRTDDGEYRVMLPQERQASQTARSLHEEALSRIKEHQAQQKESSK